MFWPKLLIYSSPPPYLVPVFLLQNNRKGLFLPCFTQNAYLSPPGGNIAKIFSIAKIFPVDLNMGPRV